MSHWSPQPCIQFAYLFSNPILFQQGYAFPLIFGFLDFRKPLSVVKTESNTLVFSMHCNIRTAAPFSRRPTFSFVFLLVLRYSQKHFLLTLTSLITLLMIPASSLLSMLQTPQSFRGQTDNPNTV